MSRSTCVECGKASKYEDRVWHAGEWLLFGMLFCCSLECGKAYAQREAAEGYRPGEPYFSCVEPEPNNP